MAALGSKRRLRLPTLSSAFRTSAMSEKRCSGAKAVQRSMIPCRSGSMDIFPFARSLPVTSQRSSTPKAKMSARLSVWPKPYCSGGA